MSNKVLLKKSSVAAKVPLTTDLSYGELALNYADGKLYFINSGNLVQSFDSSSYVRVTSNTTAAAGRKYIADTTAGTFTITLPASPNSGDSIIIADGGNFNTTPLTVARNTQSIEGITQDLSLNISGVSVTFTFDGTTWQVFTQVGAQGGTGGSGGSVANAVLTTGSYADPDWLTSLAYSKLTGTPTIPTVPTALSAFTNDSGYVTSAALNTSLASFVTNSSLVTTLGSYATQAYVTSQGYISNSGAYSNPAWLTSLAYSKITGAPTLSTVASTGSYTDLTNKPTIPTVPTALSAFTNDVGYLTSAAAGSLTGTTLKSTVVSSSLTSVGTLTSLSVSGTTTIGSRGTLYDDGNIHIHSSAGSLWLNALDNSNIELNTQTTGGVRAGGTFQMNSGYGSVAPVYGVRAWINCGWSGSAMTTRASGNLSVTRTATGVYNFTFGTAMPDGNYSINAMTQTPNANSDCAVNITNGTTPSTTGFSLTVARYGDGNKDVSVLHVQVVR